MTEEGPNANLAARRLGEGATMLVAMLWLANEKGEFLTAAISDAVIQTFEFDANEVAEIKWLSVDEIKQLLNSQPGEVIVASAFVLWGQIFAALEKQGIS